MVIHTQTVSKCVWKASVWREDGLAEGEEREMAGFHSSLRERKMSLSFLSRMAHSHTALASETHNALTMGKRKEKGD